MSEQTTLPALALSGDNQTLLAGAPQQFLHHVVVRLWPEPLAAQLPAVDDIPHQIQAIAGVVFEKVHQGLRLAAWRAQMQVGYEHRTISACPR